MRRQRHELHADRFQLGVSFPVNNSSQLRIPTCRKAPSRASALASSAVMARDEGWEDGGGRGCCGGRGGSEPPPDIDPVGSGRPKRSRPLMLQLSVSHGELGNNKVTETGASNLPVTQSGAPHEMSDFFQPSVPRTSTFVCSLGGNVGRTVIPMHAMRKC